VRNDGRVVMRGSHALDNSWVVPYNPYLCRVFGCHINVEICSSVQSVKYLYKYVKGHDRIQARVAPTGGGAVFRDEHQHYLDARYVSASEALWRICEFSLQRMYPSVQALQVHDENMQSILHREDTSVQRLVTQNNDTSLTGWMRYSREHPMDDLAKRTLYFDFPTHYTWHTRSACVGNAQASGYDREGSLRRPSGHQSLLSQVAPPPSARSNFV
jgi:hypothetical protein